MVARNTAPFIDAAIRSARAQTYTDIEIVVVDDGSNDGTKQIAAAHERMDSRVRLIDGPQKGLSAVRNASLHAAQGQFVAILDSDDILHPSHIQTLVDHQRRSGALICSSNMVEFEVMNETVRTSTFVSDALWQNIKPVSIEEFLRGGMIGSRNLSFGYLKPLIDLKFIRSKSIEYDERLRIGEDFDLIVRLMLAGANYHFLPVTTYYYRRHSGSTSYRLTPADLEGLITATRGYMAHDGVSRRLFAARLFNLEGVRRQVEALAALKGGKIRQALSLVSPHHEARRLLIRSFAESFWKRLGMPVPKPANSHEPSNEHLKTITRALQPGEQFFPMESQCAL